MIRAGWFLGCALLIISIGMLFQNFSSTSTMSVAAAGLIILLLTQSLELRRIGLTAEIVQYLAGTLMLGCATIGFFFQHIDWVLLSCFAFGFLFLLISFGAQICAKWIETEKLWARYQKHRRQTRKRR